MLLNAESLKSVTKIRSGNRCHFSWLATIQTRSTLLRQSRRIHGPNSPELATPGPPKSSDDDQYVGHLASKSDTESLRRPLPLPKTQDYTSQPSYAQMYIQTPAPTSEQQFGIRSSARQDSPLVLLVDDNSINMSLLVTFMKKLKVDYLTAQNGQEALDVFTENSSRICLVLMG